MSFRLFRDSTHGNEVFIKHSPSHDAKIPCSSIYFQGGEIELINMRHVQIRFEFYIKTSETAQNPVKPVHFFMTFRWPLNGLYFEHALNSKWLEINVIQKNVRKNDGFINSWPIFQRNDPLDFMDRFRGFTGITFFHFPSSPMFYIYIHRIYDMRFRFNAVRRIFISRQVKARQF